MTRLESEMFFFLNICTYLSLGMNRLVSLDSFSERFSSKEKVSSKALFERRTCLLSSLSIYEIVSGMFIVLVLYNGLELF